MLQQHVEPDGRLVAGGALHREEQIGLAAAQLVVDEGGVLQGEAGPLQIAGERIRQMGAQQGSRLGGVAEHGAEQLVVRSVHRHRLDKRAAGAGASRTGEMPVRLTAT